jgi:tetratricopeptide (TPR) repeat protein
LKPLAALAALLVIALSINFFINSEVNEDKLFSIYFEPSKNVTAPIVRSETDENLLNSAFIAYSESNYEVAISLFEKGFEDTKNSELLFYEANALLASGNTEEAIKKFEEHLTYSDILTNRSHWYLALTYLKSENPDKAKQELKSLIDSGEPFKKAEAKSLLKKLE